MSVQVIRLLPLGANTSRTSPAVATATASRLSIAPRTIVPTHPERLQRLLRQNSSPVPGVDRSRANTSRTSPAVATLQWGAGREPGRCSVPTHPERLQRLLLPAYDDLSPEDQGVPTHPERLQRLLPRLPNCLPQVVLQRHLREPPHKAPLVSKHRRNARPPHDSKAFRCNGLGRLRAVPGESPAPNRSQPAEIKLSKTETYWKYSKGGEDFGGSCRGTSLGY